jgi:hypothetical protein
MFASDCKYMAIAETSDAGKGTLGCAKDSHHATNMFY